MSRELMKAGRDAPVAVQDAPQAPALDQMALLMRGMADMIRTMGERMTSLEQQVRMLKTITPAQASAISAEIKRHTMELCERYQMPGCEKLVADAIRRAVKFDAGIRTMRELPSCEYDKIMLLISSWGSYKAIKAIKAKGDTKNGEQ